MYIFIDLFNFIVNNNQLFIMVTFTKNWLFACVGPFMILSRINVVNAINVIDFTYFVFRRAPSVPWGNFLLPWAEILI